MVKRCHLESKIKHEALRFSLSDLICHQSFFTSSALLSLDEVGNFEVDSIIARKYWDSLFFFGLYTFLHVTEIPKPR